MESINPDEIERRDFLKLMGASLALGGLNACTRMPAEKIIPYLEQPAELTPGKPLYYASSFTLGGYAKGVLVESHEARPTKIEGNPLHSASLGSTDIFMQAAVLSLYDPERSKRVVHLGSNSDWRAFESEIRKRRELWKKSGGSGLRVLTETVTSPTFGKELRKFLKSFPEAKWHQYEPLNQSLVRRAAELAFSRDLRALYFFENAEVVLSLDGDFLGPGPAQQHYARTFTASRRPENGLKPNRLYVAESNLSLTGAVAEHRIAMRPSEILPFALDIAALLGVAGVPAARKSNYRAEARSIAADLRAHRGKSLVVSGCGAQPELQALAFVLNEHLANRNHTIRYIEPSEEQPVDQFQSLEALVADMRAGQVESVFFLEANPVFNAPANLGFAPLLEKVPFRVRLGAYEDETSFLCHWHLPAAHFLESWGDARAFDGTVSIQQPLVAPFHEGRSDLEFLAALNGNFGLNGYQILKSAWASHSDFNSAIHDGLIKGTALPFQVPKLRTNWLKSIKTHESQEYEVTFIADPTIWDGRFSNNSWLQELPKPITQLTWDNATLVGPRTAEKLELGNGDIIRLKKGNQEIEAPVFVLPGHAEKTLTLFFGYGRTRAGQIGNGRGYDAYQLQNSVSPYWTDQITIEKTKKQMALAETQIHHTMEDRDMVIYATHKEFAEKGEDIIPKKNREEHPSLFPEYQNPVEAWAMVIDLNVCIGCKVCTIACQAENNIPVVGKEQVLNSRHMQWIRVDRYLEGDPKNLKTLFQPVPCMHCEKAPCEYVCPTVATNHSSDGLNQMVYNRCVGTRYCANNCPYKVRRFNFFAYAKLDPQFSELMKNPDVTIRSRGVIEKCTYCVQRIQEARIEAEKEDRPLRDGDVVTACQAACPTGAIVFGNKNDRRSQVSSLRASKRNYSLLAELGTKPRTTYLARLENPNLDFRKGGA
jgi:molybdopterin-containing oxidoreductase family iron-sulfur binding subunit